MTQNFREVTVFCIRGGDFPNHGGGEGASLLSVRTQRRVGEPKDDVRCAEAKVGGCVN